MKNLIRLLCVLAATLVALGIAARVFAIPGEVVAVAALWDVILVTALYLRLVPDLP